MTVTIQPGAVSGKLAAIPSKSAAHRLLICAALADEPTKIICPKGSQDIHATVRCLTGLGAEIAPQGDGYLVTPIHRTRAVGSCTLDCGESGSTLRFLLPVAAALGANATFLLAGRLAQRPMEPLAGQLTAHGCKLDWRPQSKTLTITGQLAPGEFSLPGNVSSQFFSGLLFALPLLGEKSVLRVEGDLESAGYIDLTLSALAKFGLTPAALETGGWTVPAQGYRTPGAAAVEGDWSNAAPWLCMGVLGGDGVSVTGLDNDSLQGDTGVCRVLARMGGQVTRYRDIVCARPGPLTPTVIDARNIPDLVPVLSAVAAVVPGQTRIVGAARLRLKESDRLNTTADTLNALGGRVSETQDGLFIVGKNRLTGGTVDAAGDHRIAMLAAVAAVVCEGPVTVTGAEAVEKSYPDFWKDLAFLGKGVKVL